MTEHTRYGYKVLPALAVMLVALSTETEVNEINIYIIESLTFSNETKKYFKYVIVKSGI